MRDSWKTIRTFNALSNWCAAHKQLSSAFRDKPKWVRQPIAQYKNICLFFFQVRTRYIYVCRQTVEIMLLPRAWLSYQSEKEWRADVKADEIFDA